MARSLEGRIKRVEDAGDAFNHIVHRGRHPHASYRLASLPEGYKRHDLLIHLHASSRHVLRSEVPDFCAILEYDSRHDAVDRRRLITDAESSAISGNLSPGDRQQPMLVSEVELVKEPKGVAIEAVSSMVWLQRLDHCLMFWGERCKPIARATTPMPRLVLAFPAAIADTVRATVRPSDDVDRHLRPFKFFIGDGWVQPRKRVDQAIEGGTQLMRGITDTQPNVLCWQRAYEGAKRVVAATTIRLCDDDSVTYAVKEVVVDWPYRVDVRSCSRDLEAWAIQRMHEVSSLYGIEDSKDPEGRGDTGPVEGRVGERSAEGREPQGLNSRPPAREVGRTSPAEPNTSMSLYSKGIVLR